MKNNTILKLSYRLAKKFNIKVIFYIEKSIYSIDTATAIINTNSIVLNPVNIEKRSLTGFNDMYYTGRADKINPLCKNDYFLTLKFVILHELGHFIYKTNNWIQNEILADNFALQYINEA